jgi:hypothetical protein
VSELINWLRAEAAGGLSEPPPQHRAAAEAGGWAVPGWTLQLSSTGPLENNAVVAVTVTCTAPNATHWLALYAPAGANIRFVA